MGGQVGPINLSAICITAFLAVFTLLALLALVMRLITSLFPQLREVITSVQVAAISTTFQAIIPGSQVTRIEEIK